MDDLGIIIKQSGGQPQQAGGAGVKPPPDPTPLLDPGDTVRGYVIVSQIGGGTFGQAFAAKNTRGDEACIKVERPTRKDTLRPEVIILKKVQECAYVPAYLGSGSVHNGLMYMAMELMGENILNVRRQFTKGVVPVHVSLRYAIGTLDAIHDLHRYGVVHRDIKPSNFVMGFGVTARRAQLKHTQVPDQSSPIPTQPPHVNHSSLIPHVYLIDFGLARIFVDREGTVRPARPNTGFRGTCRYASLNSHHGRDLGRVDDLWSWFYTAVEFITGTLPWRRMRDKAEVARLKVEVTPRMLNSGLPREFHQIFMILTRLRFADEPNYDKIRQLLNQALERHLSRVAAQSTSPHSSLAATTRSRTNFAESIDYTPGQLRRAQAAAAVVAAAAVAGGGGGGDKGSPGDNDDLPVGLTLGVSMSQEDQQQNQQKHQEIKQEKGLSSNPSPDVIKTQKSEGFTKGAQPMSQRASSSFQRPPVRRQEGLMIGSNSVGGPVHTARPNVTTVKSNNLLDLQPLKPSDSNPLRYQQQQSYHQRPQQRPQQQQSYHHQQQQQQQQPYHLYPTKAKKGTHHSDTPLLDQQEQKHPSEATFQKKHREHGPCGGGGCCSVS